MKYREVRTVLLKRTIQYLQSIGHSVANALEKGWLSTKFKAEATSVEAELFPDGVSGTVKHHRGRVVQLELPLW